ncbi:hypothetical protein DY245_08155 [Streptomyces inhibens]|uniref:Uncharacterized protein n=1 Tax=Streptomyces inhibens TaxID=2293571 RepID=A0A371Q819_STRIH|nr:hypothetical protein [Streptomyces inhibens]REK90809.1 hypothetical protein DY245_08155 [Streptomyces inhibens]
MTESTETERAPGAKLDELRSALDVLAMGPRHQWTDVRQVAGTLAPLVWDELKARGLWDKLPEHDHAAMYWALADGHNVATAPAPDPLRLARLISEVAHFAEECEHPWSRRRWPEAKPGRSADGTEAVALQRQFTALSPGWMTEILRRMEPPREPADWERDQRRAERPPLSVALATATDAMKRYESPPAPVSYDDRSSETSAAVVGRFTRFPEEWRVEILRRMAAGGSPLHLIAEGAMSINILHSEFRVSLAWCARPLPAHP